MDKLISIIIPCYNVEQYIDRCFGSLLSQTIGLDKLEIILVDDCSTDGTWDKLVSIEESYSESVIIVHCDENGRQGTARNIGLQYTSAPCIGYVDADDWIEQDLYEKFYEKMKDYQCDIVMCRHWRDKALPNQVLVPKLTGETDGLFTIDTVEKRKIFVTSGAIGYYVWDKLYAGDFIIQNQIFFPGGDLRGSFIFNALLLSCHKNLYFGGKTLPLLCQFHIDGTFG